MSDNIEVRAIVDRYLEHSRVFRFHNGGKEEIYISSADWMPRNFHRRVELMVPIEDATLRAKLADHLELQLLDNVKSWRLQSDGSYVRVVPQKGAPLVRSQHRFQELTRDVVRAAEVAARPGSRFHMTPTAQRSPLEGKVPKTTRRRKRQDS